MVFKRFNGFKMDKMTPQPKKKRIKLSHTEYNKLVLRVLERDNYTCQFCGCWTEERPHHKIYRSQGGSDIASNLITACCVCHRAIHDGKITIGGK
jgi:5-methylcytosine-specific restriction endonuclease McrA